ncbi:YqaE/Pmp3 family membrane protein [Confluentibacter flavum]|uniref:YqaE/Pmp3 family membrane protein n=1 Tax=Confluentibacter flavum TaxID=1909700 RepID=A0A2N3HMC2_9FLAO|nr:YqaE/Pmp3 family membrane protein [Confluentibacter flavum]PKQ46087.1 YqaE/Pmp3 family membrane protein [Confluentibacter flavum]
MPLHIIILNIILPPFAVYLKHGTGKELLISIILTIIGWIPGMIYAFWVNGK